MDAREKTRIINEGHDYIFENWIFTEPFIQKIKKKINNISNDDKEISDEDRIKLIELKKIWKEMESDEPRFHFHLPSLFANHFIQGTAEPPVLPNEMQKEIFSHLPFSERYRLATVSSIWNRFFNEIPIEKSYLYPQKSGGLVFFIDNQKPKIVRELLCEMGKDIKSDLETELYNGLRIKNYNQIEKLEKSKNETISKYYFLAIPLLFAVLLSYYYESNKLFYGSLAMLVFPIIMDPFHRSAVSKYKNEPIKAKNDVHEYFGAMKR